MGVYCKYTKFNNIYFAIRIYDKLMRLSCNILLNDIKSFKIIIIICIHWFSLIRLFK